MRRPAVAGERGGMTPPDLDRRGLLRGLGLLAAAPTILAAAPSAPAAAAAAVVAGPECLADLIESGAVDRADLVAR